MVQKGNLCWNQSTRKWEACPQRSRSRGGNVGTAPPPQCCIKPACCIVCKDLNRLMACINNTVPNLTLFGGDITPDEQTFRRYLEFIECAYGINRTNLNFSIVDYSNLPLITYTDVPCYAAPVSLTNVGVNCNGIWVRQCLILTPTQIECPTIGVCFETMAVPAVGGLPGEYSLMFQNTKLCLNPVDYSAGLNCDNCAQQPPTP